MRATGVSYSVTLPRLEVVGVSITALLFKEQISRILAWGKQRSSRIVCVANVHMLMEARFNDGLQRALTKADMVTPDGMPLVWVMRFLGRTAQDRVAGMDIFTAVCKQSVQENVSIYLLGATQDVLDKVVAKLRVDFPTLNVAGFESPPFRKWTFLEEEAIAERVNQSGAGITFVSLGCPKQECWMESNHGRVKSVMIGVGGVFPVYAGNKKHAPGWMRNNGLEWLYRLAQEPQRLFKRYFTTIPPFIWLAFQQIRQEQKRRGFLQN